MASNNFDLKEFESRELLVDELAKKIMSALEETREKKEYATLVLSGGSTPKKLLTKLSNFDFDWERVRVTLVDERWVDAKSDESNEKLIREYLLINRAEKAKFIQLKTDAKYAKDGVESLNMTLEKLSERLDVVVLGMGLDGHTASFFPYANELNYALNTNDLVCATTATVKPKERVTLTRKYLLDTQKLFLHIEGKEKKEVFLRASSSNNISSMPIIAMMQQKRPLLEVYYAD